MTPFEGKIRTPYEVAEQIQTRFTFDDDGEVIACTDRYMSDILGSDWTTGEASFLTASEYYALVRERAARKYGELPF